MISEETMDQYAESISEYTGGKYVHVHRSILERLDGEANSAVVFSRLTYVLSLKLEHAKDKELLMRHDLWFRYPVKSIRAFLHMKPDRIRTAIRKLVEANLIEISYRKRRAMWVRIIDPKSPVTPLTGNPTHWQRPPLQVAGNARHSKSPVTPATPNNKSLLNKSLNKQRVAHRNNGCTGFFDQPEKRTPEYILASKLDHILRTKEKELLRETHLPSWAKHFRKLLNHRTEDQIDAMLDWYNQNIDNDWCPQKYAAKTFCEDYPKLEEARKRFAKKERDREYQEALANQFN